MKKIEEVAAILIEEISEFKILVIKFEELIQSSQVNSKERLFSEIQDSIHKSIECQKSFQEQFHAKLNGATDNEISAIGIPKWLLMVFGITGLFLVMLIGYSVYQIKSIPEIQEEYHKKGQDEAIEHFRSFFDTNKSAADSYENWINTKEK